MPANPVQTDKTNNDGVDDMKTNQWMLSLAAIAAMNTMTVSSRAAEGQAPVGYTDTPMLPGGKWHVHDPDRPQPRVVTPAKEVGQPPSDAIVLFGGTDLS